MKLSVLIPCYNEERYILTVIDSIFKNNTHLTINIDLNKKQYELFLNDKQIGEVKV